MIIKNLKLNNYRNFSEFETNFNKNLNIFIGDNGFGKTNILESIYLLIEGESFRYTKEDSLIKLNESSSSIKSSIQNNDLNYQFKLNLNETKKELFINEKKTKVDTLKLPPIILFSPESLSVIKESSDQRRQLLDQLSIQSHFSNRNKIKEFKKTLKTRNRILKDLLNNLIDKKSGLDVLESINSIFLKQAAELTYLRISELNNIKNDIENGLIKLNKNTETQIQFDYQYLISEKDHKTSEFSQIHDAMQKRMEELRSAELSSGISLVGPQKHDIIFLYNGNDSRFYCSQGQQRSIILAFKMAQIVYHHKVHGFYPVLLLDDVMSELDLNKQESLITTLNQTDTQTFVTTTDVQLLSKMSISNTSVFKIKNGVLDS